MTHTTHSKFVGFILTIAFIAPAHADDIWLRVVDGALVTGSITERGTPIAEIVRVFGAAFGEDPKFPFAAFDPGIQSPPGRATAGATFAFLFPGPLLAWDGASFGPHADTVTINFGPASATSSDGPTEGFEFAASDSGAMHLHWDFVLNGIDGSDPAIGVYALPLRLEGISPQYRASPTFWTVFNNGADKAVHDAAIRNAALYLACEIDLDGDGLVSAPDLGVMLGAWGSADPALDLDEDGTVGASDLGILLGAWGFRCSGE